MKKQLLSLFAVAATAVVVQAQNANVQIIHNCPTQAAGTVDIYVNLGSGFTANPLVDNLSFRAATAYLQVPAGLTNARVAIAPEFGAGTMLSDTLVSFALPTLMANTSYVAVAAGEIGSSSHPFNLFFGAGALTAGSSNDFDVNIFHGSTDAPAVAIFTNLDALTPVVPTLAFGAFTGTATLPAADLLSLLTPATDFNTMVEGFGIPLATLNAGGGAGVVFASGKLAPSMGEPAFGLFVALPDGTVLPLPQTDASRIQIVHNSPDPMVASVDIDVVTSAGAVIPFNNVGYLQATEYLLVPSDNYRVLFSAPNSADTSGALVKIPATLMKNTTYQVAAAGLANTSGTNFAHSVSVNGTNVAFGLDVISGSRPWSISPTTVSIAVFHHSPDAPMVDAVGSTGSVLVNDISFGEYQGYLPIPTIADGQIRITPANDNNTTVATFAAPLTQLSGLGLTIFATGFLTPNDENISNLQPFGLWVAFPNGGNLVELTPVMSLESGSGISQMNLFPNPVNEVSTLTFSSTRSFNAELSIVNIMGREVAKLGQVSLMEGSNSIEVNTNSLSSGQYLLTLTGTNARVAIPFIK
jgi:hypothetical protein